MSAVRFRLAGFGLGLAALIGCQQRMAEQPGHRGYEANSFFPDGQGVRPLEPGVVYRGQRPAADPMVTGLSAEGLKARAADPTGKAAWDEKNTVPPPGAPDKVENYVKEFPFEVTEADLKRGQQRFNIYCAVCHGAAGDGNGKIVERGYLRPPSYHTDPDGKLADNPSTGLAKVADPAMLPQGYSRGFGRYGVKVPIKDVPVGYMFQVITWGFGGMPELAYQVTPEDRWKIIAYIRALQLSQGAAVNDLPAEAKAAAQAGLNKPANGKAGGKH